jgi:hypothetical protein
MKHSKHETRSENRLPVRSVSLQIRDFQVSLKVRSAVPQAAPQAARAAFR